MSIELSVAGIEINGPSVLSGRPIGFNVIIVKTVIEIRETTVGT